MQTTLDKEKQVIEVLVKKITNATDEQAQVIASNDYTEERGPFIVVVGIPNSIQVNFGLPDYEYTVQINIDCFIDEDKGGYIFERIKGDILSYLQTYIMDQSKLSELFDDIPIVGLIFDGISNSVTQQSNKCIIQFKAIASY